MARAVSWAYPNKSLGPWATTKGLKGKLVQHKTQARAFRQMDRIHIGPNPYIVIDKIIINRHI